MNKILIILGFLLFGVVNCMAVNRALLVGIGKYDQTATGWNILHGDKDIELLKPELQKKGFSDIQTLVNEKATKKAIVSALKDLARRSRKGDKVIFLFSGHGQRVRDDNHDEGKNKNYDESIVPYDACRNNLKMGGTYDGRNHLIDDELAPLLNEIKKKLGAKGELLVVVDACYSEGVHKDEVTDLDPELLKYLRGTNDLFVPPKNSTYLADVPKPGSFTPGARMIVLTACGSKERNFEYKIPPSTYYGSLCYYIYRMLQKGVDFSRWAQTIKDKEYIKYKIFQGVQHPSAIIIP